MNVIKNTTALKRVSSIQIPDAYYRRFKTGIEDLDLVFGGQGFLPGSTFTLAAGPGTGKTTLLLQTLEALESSKKKTAYISAEESAEQVAFSCKRLGVKHVSVANMSCIEDIFEAVAGYDIVILDSFPALTCREGLRGVRKEEYISNYIISKAKELEIVVGSILHFTKAGTYKGSTLLPHSVDMNMIMSRDADDDALRVVETTKNRFGQTGFVTFAMGTTGFDFTDIGLTKEESSSKSAPKAKESVLENRERVILEALKKPLTLGELSTVTGESLSKVRLALYNLSTAGKISKKGRGVKATYVTAKA